VAIKETDKRFLERLIIHRQNSRSPSVPYKTYTEKDAKEALGFAKEILKKVKEKNKGGIKMLVLK
jgi:HEPN domain-containing protein